ncbi:MAG TPA: M28 family peptidase [Agriterribacter sp.]|nr:M28 family peptidase [Agriterribacter sp.]
MIRAARFLVILFLLNTGVHSQSKPKWKSVFQLVNNEVEQNAAAYHTLREATNNIGARLTGSIQGSQAETYTHDLLQSYGLPVRYEPFEAEGWSRGSLNLTINGKEYKAVSLAHSPVESNVSANLVDMGNGLKDDYLNHPEAAMGKIVLASLGLLPGSAKGLQNLHRSEKTALAIQYGAKGIIFFNAAPGGILLTGTASVTGMLISIPALCIGKEDGLQLKKQMETASLRASINMTNFSGKITARNVIATLKGKTKSDEKIVIGAHLDSWDLATGAIDNGIGAFSVIDIARTFQALNLQPQRTIEFVLFMGEEQGLLGSKAYIKKTLEDSSGGQIRYMLNLDMSNDPKGYSATTEDDKLLFNAIGSIANSIDTSFTSSFSSGFGLHSDHQPFMLQGIPTAGVSGSLSREVLNCYHADCDVFSWVNEREMKNTVRFTAMLLYGLADSEALNAKQLKDNELEEALIKSHLKEALQTSGDWRWN